MGKHRIRESLIRKIVNIVVHELVAMRTNRPEAAHFLQAEIIEYRTQAEKTAEEYHWNETDKEQIAKKALSLIKERLLSKYPDVNYSEHDAVRKLADAMKNIM